MAINFEMHASDLVAFSYEFLKYSGSILTLFGHLIPSLDKMGISHE